jgi:hypothetical protein
MEMILFRRKKIGTFYGVCDALAVVFVVGGVPSLVR